MCISHTLNVILLLFLSADSQFKLWHVVRVLEKIINQHLSPQTAQKCSRRLIQNINNDSCKMSWFCRIKLEAHGGLLAYKTVNIMCMYGTNLTYLWFCRNVQSHHLCQVTGMSDGHALANHGSHLVTGGQFFCSVFPEFKPLYIG